MLDFSKLVMDDRLPVYEQIILFVKRSIAFGGACDGDALPSRRELAVLLDINPNTVQKAFRQMEEEKIIETIPNHGSYIRISEESKLHIAHGMKEQVIRNFVQEAKRMGLSLEQVENLLGDMWERE